MSLKGVDVSRWQGLINWQSLAHNVDFAIIKIGGSDQGFYADGQGVRNVLEARAQNMPIGFYVFLGGASSPADEVANIKNLISGIGGLRAGEFIALDFEVEHSDSVGYVRDIANGLIERGINAPVVYTNLDRINRFDWSPVVGLGCPLWVAAWGNNDQNPDDNEVPKQSDWPSYAFWQYSSVGVVQGITGRVDLDLFNGDFTAFKKIGSPRNVSIPVQVTTARPTVSGGAEYTVVAGDNLSLIAAKWGKTWQELWNINRDRVADPDKIFPGLKLRVWSELAAPVVAAPAVSNVRTHVVENGENLSVIAAKYGLPNWTILWQANQAVIGGDPNLIRPGMTLVIP